MRRLMKWLCGKVCELCIDQFTSFVSSGGIYLQGYTVREQPYGFKKSTIELKPLSDEFKTFYLCSENPNENKRLGADWLWCSFYNPIKFISQRKQSLCSPVQQELLLWFLFFNVILSKCLYVFTACSLDNIYFSFIQRFFKKHISGKSSDFLDRLGPTAKSK